MAAAAGAGAGSATATALHPLFALVKEVVELLDAVDVDTDREYTGSEPLHKALVSSGGRLGHEMLRFTLVVRSGTADGSSLGEVAAILAGAASTLVAAVQLATKPSCAGAAYRADVRAAAKQALRAVGAALHPLAAAFGDALTVEAVTTARVRAATADCGPALVAAASVIARMCDGFSQLPTCDSAAVKRRVLGVAKLVKTSVSEVCDEHKLDARVIAATRGSGSSGGAGAAGGGASKMVATIVAGAGAGAGAAVSDAVAESATTAASASAGGAGASALPRDGSSGGGSSDDGDTFDAGEDLTPVQRAEFVTCGVAALQHTFQALRHVCSAIDAIAPELAPPAGSGERPAAGSASVERVAVLRRRLDAMAAATSSLEDAVIDVAAAVNEVDVAEAAVAARALDAAAAAMVAACRIGAEPGGKAPAAADAAFTAAVRDVASALSAALVELAVARTVSAID